MDDALYAAIEGDVATTDRALELAAAEGLAPVGAIRQAMAQMQKLHRARIAMRTDGLSAADATRTVRPPIFFRRAPAFTRALNLWPEPTLLATLAALSDAERACKRTGAPDEVLARNAILTIARRAAIARPRGRG
jgi:DNA polymerase-3 subunit delta